MRFPRAAPRAGFFVLLIVSTAAVDSPSPEPTGAPSAIVAAYGRNDSLRTYTFHMDVAMSMKHFPWLHFQMQGIGVYERGVRYSVHFTSMPWFAPKQQNDIDLSMIDPSMWPKRYTYQKIGQQDGDTLFSLHSINDPSVKSATAAISPSSGARWIDVSYTDGSHIHMAVSSGSVDGFLLPTSLNADVDEPHMPLSANASFSDYDLSPPASK